MHAAEETRIRETKRTLDGRRQSFDCSLVLSSVRLMIVRFDHPAPRTAGGFSFPTGSYTTGFFWRGRNYNLYRMAAPDGRVIACRFDVVDGVRSTPGHVCFTDLLLDVWVAPDGTLRVEDEDEVAAALAAGLLSERRSRLIEKTRHLLMRDHARIIAEAERELAALRTRSRRSRTAAHRRPVAPDGVTAGHSA